MGLLTADYSVFANNGTSVWVSFYNYNTGCESYRTPYTFYVSSTPSVIQDYAKKCRNEVAKVQLSSNLTGVTFQLYELFEYYDPVYGTVQDYQMIQNNSTGYFEITGFNPGEADKYYAKAYHPSGCSMPFYYQLWFDVITATGPSVAGNLSVTQGSSTTLTASGAAPYFKWYDAGGNLVYNGSQFPTPTSLAAGTYTYQVKGVSSDGTCLTDPTLVIVSVLSPPVTYTPLFTSSDFTKTIDLTRPVGTVAGSPGTTSSGGVGYSIPVYAPPGTNGMQPSVSITYNSQGSSGIAGWGWNISGLSVISRTGKNIYHDGIVAPLTYTSSDAFLLDGMRLNVITGSNGANGTVYATEAESFAKIISYTTGSDNNPDWFKVTAKDGSIMEFGNTADSRVMTENGSSVMLWRLNRVQDINGNYIDFVYDNNLRDSRIKTIKYTGNVNTGLTPYNAVSFEYKLRTDKNAGYDAGGSLSSQHLLDKITVTVDDNTIVKNYQLNYGFDNVNSLLKEVVESSGDGVLLNSTIFLYGDQPQDIVTVSETGNSFTGSKDFVSGDFDGDGKTDLLSADFYFNNGIKYHTAFSVHYDFNNGDPYYLYGETLALGYSAYLGGNKSSNFLTSDYNKDGRDDIAIVNTPVDVTVYPNRRILNKTTINYTGSYNTSTGTTTITKDNFLFPTVWGEAFKYIHDKGNFFIPGDFDGDGNQDFITILAKSRTVGSPPSVTYYFDYKAFISSPATGEINQEIGNFGFGPDTYLGYYAVTIADADLINVFDFDGDGKMEILVTKDQNSYVLSINRVFGSPDYFTASVIYTSSEITKDSKIFPGDFNGDRKTDFLVKNSSDTWKILHGTGTAFTASAFTFNQAITFTGDPILDDKLVVSDFNGDGRSDIMHGFALSGSSVSNFSLYFSRGKGAGFYNEVYNWPKSLLYGDITVGDFNGDGRSDILRRENINSKIDFVSFRPFSQERLLKKVTDGHNTTSAFEYKLLTDKSSYPYFYDRTVSLDDPANENPYNYIQLPLYAVSSMAVPDGIGGSNITTFEYEDAVIHRAAKGFLGFKKVSAKNAVTGITSVTENEINSQFAVPYNVKQTTRLTATGELLSETQAAYSFTDLSTGNGDIRYLQKIDKTLNIDHLTGRASESVNTYDSDGNITINVTKAGILSGGIVTATETTTTTTTYLTVNGPVAARPGNVTVSTTRTGKPAISVTTSFTYTTNGNIATKTNFSGLPQAVTSTLTYNDFGNPLTEVTGSTGLTDYTVTKEYDTKGRFVLIKTHSGGSLSQTETYSYDPQWGQPLSHTTGDCLTTTFEYDIFGRLKKTTFPQGFSVNNSLAWDVSGNNVYYAFTDYPGGKPDIKTWFDKLGRETKTETAGFNNQWLTRLTTYNAKGQVAVQTNDYYSSETPLTTTNTYDVYGRLISATNTINTVSNTYTKLSDGLMQVVKTPATGQSSASITDASGRIITATDNGGQLDFDYDSRGNQVEVKHGNTVLVTSVYDAYGKQTSLTDINAGTITYVYDALGRLTQQTDAKSNTYNLVYDGLGRILSRTGPEGVTAFEYYVAGSCNNNSPVKITGFNGVIKEYTYDTYRRPATEKVTIDGVAFTTSFTYNDYNALTKIVYPSGVEENRVYDVTGGLLTVTGGNAGSPVTLFTASDINGFGQYTDFTLGNGKTAQHTYHYGTPTRYYTAGVQDLNFTWDYAKGNLLTRSDAIKTITENFTFDNLNRLKTATVNGTEQFVITYDGTASSSKGNIISKTDAGNYVYKTDKIHAVAYITNLAGAQTPPNNISTIEQQITYMPFLKTATVTEAPYGLEFTYGPDYERVKTLLKNNSVLQETRLFLGSYEKQIIAGGATREIHYISGGNGLCAILVKEAGVVTPYYVYTDHLGSILTITNAAGAATTEQNFDAWGRKRNPANWQYESVPATPPWLYRGFTGHEHLLQFALINMNGRIYDPIQGRMLSPDNLNTSPWYTQRYNKYSYAMNNPLSYIDPDGNDPVTLAIVIGAAIGAYSGGLIANNGQLNPVKWDWNSGRTWGFMLGGAVIGAGAGYIGGTVAASGMPFANTAGILSSSFFNSVGMNMLTGGQMPVSAGFGFGSYGFQSGEFNYLGKKGNSFLTNFGYTFGALANLQDMVAGVNGITAEYRAEKGGVPHARMKGEYSEKEIDISVAHDPAPSGSYKYDGPSDIKNSLDYARYWATHIVRGKYYGELGDKFSKLQLNNVNGNWLVSMTSRIKNEIGMWGIGKLNYGTSLFGCQSHVAHALWGVGVPTLPINIHPMVLYAQLAIRQAGIFASPYLIR